MALLDHVGLKVTDLERAIDFYTNVLELELQERRPFGGGVQAAGIRVGEGDGIVFLLAREDFTRHEPGGPSGVDHFGITYPPEQWERVMAKLRERNTPFVEEVVERSGRTGRSPSQYVLDPDGNQIEVKRW